METEILIVGGGTSGVCAALQAARQGRAVIVVEESPWLGGMLTAAGVSATDGNHHLPSGIWGEFRQALYDRYGGPDAVKTGWVSHTLFEPRVGHDIFQKWLQSYDSVTVYHGYWPVKVLKANHKVKGIIFQNAYQDQLEIQALLSIDATEYGDVLELSGCRFDYGRESRSQSGEAEAPEKSDRTGWRRLRPSW